MHRRHPMSRREYPSRVAEIVRVAGMWSLSAIRSQVDGPGLPVTDAITTTLPSVKSTHLKRLMKSERGVPAFSCQASRPPPVRPSYCRAMHGRQVRCTTLCGVVVST